MLERKIKTEAEPSSIARTQRQLGGILDDLGRYEGAVKCYRGALEVQVRSCTYIHIHMNVYIRIRLCGMYVYEVFLMISAVMRALLNATAAPSKYRCADVYAYI